MSNFVCYLKFFSLPSILQHFWKVGEAGGGKRGSRGRILPAAAQRFRQRGTLRLDRGLRCFKAAGPLPRCSPLPAPLRKKLQNIRLKKLHQKNEVMFQRKHHYHYDIANSLTSKILKIITIP